MARHTECPEVDFCESLEEALPQSLGHEAAMPAPEQGALSVPLSSADGVCAFVCGRTRVHVGGFQTQPTGWALAADSRMLDCILVVSPLEAEAE